MKPPDDRVDQLAWDEATGPWVQVPAHPLEDYQDCDRRTKPFRLYCWISSWYDGDIIEANIQNCLQHGADRVLVLDNASPDDTHQEALLAHAHEVRSFYTPFYMEAKRIALMNAWVREVVESEPDATIWACCLDADEFLQVSNHQTLRDFLSELDSMVNVVGFDCIEHFPTPGQTQHNVLRQHPAKWQPLIWRRPSTGTCHWKHCLRRYRNGVYDACFSRGFHTTRTRPSAQLVEPSRSLALHHFPYRNESRTRTRLAALCTPSEVTGSYRRSAPDDNLLHNQGAIRRFQYLEAVYDGRYDLVQIPHSQRLNSDFGLEVHPWNKLMDAESYLPIGCNSDCL